MKAFDTGIFKLRGVYLFADLTRLTGISRQTLRRAADESRLIVFKDRPSMTRGDWFLDYLTNRKSMKIGFGVTNGKRQRLPRTAPLGRIDSPRADMVGDHQSAAIPQTSNTEVNS